MSSAGYGSGSGLADMPSFQPRHVDEPQKNWYACQKKLYAGLSSDTPVRTDNEGRGLTIDRKERVLDDGDVVLLTGNVVRLLEGRLKFIGYDHIGEFLDVLRETPVEYVNVYSRHGDHDKRTAREGRNGIGRYKGIDMFVRSKNPIFNLARGGWKNKNGEYTLLFFGEVGKSAKLDDQWVIYNYFCVPGGYLNTDEMARSAVLNWKTNAGLDRMKSEKETNISGWSAQDIIQMEREMEEYQSADKVSQHNNSMAMPDVLGHGVSCEVPENDPDILFSRL